MSDVDRLIERLQQLSADVEVLTDERNRLIVKLRRRGLSLRQIGEAAGLSHAAIAKIERRDS
jgi:lambda repressor-like predicted transcriptional regulator